MRSHQADWPRVLLADDSVSARERIRNLIKKSCLAKIVGEAAPVVDTLFLCGEHRPDAIVMDLQLADGTAYEILGKIKHIHPPCVVIILTNFDMPECRECCREMGADYFFKKLEESHCVPQILATLPQSRP